MADPVQRHPFEGYIYGGSSAFKIVEYRKLMGPFKFEKRLVPPSGIKRRNELSPCIFLGRIPSTDVLCPRQTVCFNALEGAGRYEELGEMVALQKALYVYAITKKPVVVEVVHFFGIGMSGFPGHLTEALEDDPDNLILKKLVSNDLTCRRSNRRAVAIATLAAIIRVDGDRHVGFQVRHGRVDGVIKESNAGKGWPAYFQPDGSEKTFSEMTLVEKNGFSMRARVVDELRANPFIDPLEYGC